MLVAAKHISIDTHELRPGDLVTPEMEALLPPGRLKKLEDAGWVRNAADDTLSLEHRVAILEEQVASLLQKQSRAPRAPETQE